MAWTAPRSWTSSMVTAAMFNTDIKANSDALSGHEHSGDPGDGSATLSGVSLSALVTPVLASQGSSPGTAGMLLRKGNNLEYHNGSDVVGLYADGVAGTATLRTIGTGSTQAAAGNHTH